MDHILFFALLPSSDDIEHVFKLTLAVGASAAAVAGILPLAMKTDNMMKWAGKKGQDLFNKATNAGKRVAGGAKEEAQGNLARQYDPSKSGWRGRNLAIRAATGNLASSEKRGARKVIAMGRAHEDAAVKDAENLLRAAKVKGDSQKLAQIVAGQKVSTPTGGVIDGSNPVFQRAAMKSLIANRDGAGFEALMKAGPGVNWDMVADEVNQEFPTVKDVGAHFAKGAFENQKRQREGRAPMSGAELDQMAHSELSGLSYEKLATQSQQALEAAERGRQLIGSGGYKYKDDVSFRQAGENQHQFYTRVASEAKYDAQQAGETDAAFQSRVYSQIRQDVATQDANLTKNAEQAMKNQQVARSVKEASKPVLNTLAGNTNPPPQAPPQAPPPPQSPPPQSPPPPPSNPQPPQAPSGGAGATPPQSPPPQAPAAGSPFVTPPPAASGPSSTSTGSTGFVPPAGGPTPSGPTIFVAPPPSGRTTFVPPAGSSPSGPSGGTLNIPHYNSKGVSDEPQGDVMAPRPQTGPGRARAVDDVVDAVIIPEPTEYFPPSSAGTGTSAPSSAPRGASTAGPAPRANSYADTDDTPSAPSSTRAATYTPPPAAAPIPDWQGANPYEGQEPDFSRPAISSRPATPPRPTAVPPDFDPSGRGPIDLGDNDNS